MKLRPQKPTRGASIAEILGNLRLAEGAYDAPLERWEFGKDT